MYFSRGSFKVAVVEIDTKKILLLEILWNFERALQYNFSIRDFGIRGELFKKAGQYPLFWT